MGQQQLLLVILVTILVGIATVVAINVFGESAEQANADAVRQDLLSAASNAQAIWTKPTQLGGAGGDFLAETLTAEALLQQLRIPGTRSTEGEGEAEVGIVTNENGVYRLGTIASNSLVVEAEPSSYRNDIRLTVTRNLTTDSWDITIVDDL